MVFLLVQETREGLDIDPVKGLCTQGCSPAGGTGSNVTNTL